MIKQTAIDNTQCAPSADGSPGEKKVSLFSSIGSASNILLLLIKGAIVGTGAILPGISGGVLLVAFGIYEPMMEILAHPIKAIPKYYKMFIPFIIGWLSGFVLLARVVELLFAKSSVVALMLFSGLILGTIPKMISKSEESSKVKEAALSASGSLYSPGKTFPDCSSKEKRGGIKNFFGNWSPLIISLSFFYLLFNILSQDGALSVSASLPWFLFCGLIWGLSLVVPGLSSSSILIYMGLYEPMTSGIAAFDLSVILPLLTGLAITVALTAHFVNRLFKEHYATVSKIIIGIMLASTLMIIPTEFGSVASAALSIVCFILGFGISRFMDVAKGE